MLVGIDSSSPSNKTGAVYCSQKGHVSAVHACLFLMKSGGLVQNKKKKAQKSAQVSHVVACFKKGRFSHFWDYFKPKQ